MAWELFDRDVGGFQICGIDGGALSDAPFATLPVACEITVTAESAAPAALEATEQDLERVTDSLGGRLVATSRTRTTLTSLVYLPDDDDADRYTRITLPRAASISVAPAIDPEWTLFDAARPAGIEEQSMFDFRVRTQLNQAGDIGGVRPIDHVVTGLTHDTVDGFTAAISSLFTNVEGASRGDDPAVWRVSHEGDPTHVTESSWTIRLIAERFDASYDGWGCAVLTPSPPPGAGGRGRRWFRRS